MQQENWQEMRYFNIYITPFIIFSVVGFVNCRGKNNNKAKDTKSQTAVRPNTPESVVRVWELEVAKNNFGYAKQLSIGKTLKVIQSLEDLSREKESQFDVVNIEFVAVTCKEVGDEAVCDCLLRDEIGEVENRYLLVKQNNTWFLEDVLDSDDIKKKSARVNIKPQRDLQ